MRYLAKMGGGAGMCVLTFFALEQSGGAEQNHRRDDEHGGYCGDGRVDLIA